MKKFLTIFVLFGTIIFATTDYIARGIYTAEGKYMEGENVEIKHPLASITKLMSSLVVFDKISQGKISLDTKVTVLEIESKLDGSKMNLKAGEEIKVEDLLKGMLLGNQNNATIILTRVVANSEENFVKLMNEKAKSLGMKNSIFFTATGMNADITQKKADVGTIEDISKMLKAVYKNKALSDMIAQKSTKIKNDTLVLNNVNTAENRFLKTTGIRVGVYGSSGYNGIFKTKKETKEYTIIILGALSQNALEKQMNKDIATLINEYKTTILVSAGEFIIEAPLKDGKNKRIELFASGNLIEESKEDRQLNKYVFLPKEIKAPIKKGEKIGTYIVSFEGKELGRTDLVSTQDIPKSNFLDEIKKKFTK